MSFTYAELTTALQDFPQNYEATYVSQIPRFIRLAEERILKSTRLNVFQKLDVGAVVSGTATYDVPADFLYPISFSLTVSGSEEYLRFKELDFVQSYAPDPATTGQPKYYAQYDVDTLYLGPTPDANYAANLVYGYRPASLVDAGSSGTTWLSTNAEQALLYGALVEGYIFMKGDADMLEAYNTRFTDALSRLKNFGEALETTDEYRSGRIRKGRS